MGETGAVTPAHLNILSPPTFCLTEMELPESERGLARHTLQKVGGKEGAREEERERGSKDSLSPPVAQLVLGADTKEGFIPRKRHFKIDPGEKRKVLVLL